VPSLANQSQIPVTILCDTGFDRSQLNPPPGIIYRSTFDQSGYPTAQIEQEIGGVVQILTIPLPIDLVGKSFPRTVSPDGRYLASIPIEHNLPLAVWEIGTANLSTIPLSNADIDYLLGFVGSPKLEEKFLTWTSDNNLLIQYFDLDVANLYEHIIGHRLITVAADPLQLSVGPREDIAYPSLPVPPNHGIDRPMFSSQGNYVTQVSNFIGQSFQVYNLQTGQPALVFDLQSDNTQRIVGQPLWAQDEQEFFVEYETDPESSPTKFAIAQVDVSQGFQIRNDLQSALESTFGTSTSISVPSFAVFDPSGQVFVLRITTPNSGKHLIFYNTDNETITAICDDGDIRTGFYFPIWGPNSDYFGYQHAGSFVAYDLNTGTGYATNGSSLIGWVPDTQNTELSSEDDDPDQPITDSDNSSEEIESPHTDNP